MFIKSKYTETRKHRMWNAEANDEEDTLTNRKCTKQKQDVIGMACNYVAASPRWWKKSPHLHQFPREHLRTAPVEACEAWREKELDKEKGSKEWKEREYVTYISKEKKKKPHWTN